MTLQDQVSNNVRVISAAAGTTPSALARRLGRSPQWIQAKLSGRNRWSVQDVESLSELLEVDAQLMVSSDWWPEVLLRACRDSNPKPSDLWLVAA